MRWHSISRSRLGMLTAIAIGALARDAAAQQSIGEFTAQGDVGRVTRPGSATYDSTTGMYQLAGSGANIWAARDAFHYAWRKMKGDFILTARGQLVGKGVDPHRKFGWMIRSSLDSAAVHASAAVHGDGLVSLQFRKTPGGQTEQVQSPVKGADVIQLERRGGTYIMSVAKFGDTLSSVQATDIPLGDDVYVGLFITAHNDTVTERATLSDVRITVPAPAGFVPYRQYLNSNVEIMEVATGNRRIVYRATGSVQAPNWTRDGKALIWNQDGKLYRFDLATRTPTEINTAPRNRNNNDHVLSFDGKWLAISDGSDSASRNQSVVYVVPTEGGTPRRITEKFPSYLHGWSPDGKTLVFTGIRGTAIDIYSIPVAGGPEHALTQNQAMNDGPEYGPDGKIYFNSTRSGKMQVWRMNADGSAPEQLTNDTFNNWFPHVAPDGKSLVYIAFPPDITPTDHPWYKHVSLRSMPVSGGPAKVLAHLYGGQGTINVPSWSPDGKFIAFVSNTDKY
jgi:Tol biopolymer transport system component